MALGTFELQIQRFVDKANGNLDKVVRKIALDLFFRVIEKSPVDTGRFKSNWLVSVNSIPQGTTGERQVVHDAAGQRRVVESGAFDKNASFARVRAASPMFAAGQVIYLVNNLTYARALEYGHSKQAPSGMVRLSVMEYGAVVTKAASEVPK